MGAEILSHGIPPDIAGDARNRIATAKNVVVIGFFPESLFAGLAKFVSGALFKETDELRRVSSVSRSSNENVNVIRHKTIRVKKERLTRRALEENSDSIFRNSGRRKMWNALVGTDAKKVRVAAAIMRW